jgi:hypothetical protein
MFPYSACLHWLLSVLNPGIRLGWIRKNWDEIYVKKAEGVIKGLVRFWHCTSECLLTAADGGHQENVKKLNSS